MVGLKSEECEKTSMKKYVFDLNHWIELAKEEDKQDERVKPLFERAEETGCIAISFITIRELMKIKNKRQRDDVFKKIEEINPSVIQLNPEEVFLKELKGENCSKEIILTKINDWQSMIKYNLKNDPKPKYTKDEKYKESLNSLDKNKREKTAFNNFKKWVLGFNINTDVIREMDEEEFSKNYPCTYSFFATKNIFDMQGEREGKEKNDFYDSKLLAVLIQQENIVIYTDKEVANLIKNNKNIKPKAEIKSIKD